MIKDAKDMIGYVQKHGYVAYLIKLLRNRSWDVTPDWTERQGKVQAYVKANKWFAYCPDPECHGAIALCKDEPIFFCPDCANIKNDHRPYRVVFKDREKIERLMTMRKDPRTRNFIRGETLFDLLMQNDRHGELDDDFELED